MSSIPGINPETGEAIMSSSPRFTKWAALLVFSTITLGSSVEVRNSQIEETPDAKGAVTCSALAFVATVITTGMHMHPLTNTMIAGTKIEGGVCAFLLAIWAITVSIVSDANNNLAVGNAEASVINQQGQTNTVLNGNLYYFSWAGFVTIIILATSYAQAVFGIDVAGELRSRAARLNLWSGMLAASVVVMGACINVLEINCNQEDDNFIRSYCERTKFGISVGALGVFFSLVVVGIKLATAAAPFVVEGILSFLLSILNAFGVAYITSAKGPGSAIGNLYYFSWISFLCSTMLVASCYSDYTSAITPSDDNKQDDQNGHAMGSGGMNVINGGGGSGMGGTNDFPVEDLPPDTENI